MKDIKYDFDDILIVPECTSEINSRAEICMLIDDSLPLFTAPMDTVVDMNNYLEFTSRGIITIQPRGLTSYGNVSINKLNWFSYSLTEFENIFIDNDVKLSLPDDRIHALIDIANGNMLKLRLIVERAKNKYGNRMVLMVGNVANPETFNLLAHAGADYVRLGVGNGNACLTSANLGVGYPMASLIAESYELKKWFPTSVKTKIVADGGMKNYSDIIKALALGADYVMIGSIFNKALESAGRNFYHSDGKYCEISSSDLNLPVKITLEEYSKSIQVYKQFRGMSTKEVQKDWGKTQIKTSEGICTFNKVEYTLQQWVDNFKDYLASAMSYCNALTLEDFIGQANTVQITNNAFKRFNK